jgi:cytochrome c5
MPRAHTLWLSALLLAALAALTIGLAAQEPERGERVQNASCTSGCHGIRPIQVQALDEAGWLALVRTEIARGAEVAEADVPILVEFLARNHGPLPDGPGKQVMLTTCTVCHDLRRIRLQSADEEGWEETLLAMLNEGAMLTDRDFYVLLDYLSIYFGAF